MNASFVTPHCLEAEDPEFPRGVRALHAAPLRLYCFGNTSLFGKPAIGICGARGASNVGLAHARRFGQLAAEYGVTVVSGYSRGVDMSAHKGALERQGTTIAVLAEGIRSARVKRELAVEADFESRLLLVSEFAPDAPWTVWRAMKRNETICALASATVVVEAGESGGTLAAGRECLHQGKPLWVIQYGDAPDTARGNALLIQKGGTPVKTLKELRTLIADLVSRQPAGVK